MVKFTTTLAVASLAVLASTSSSVSAHEGHEESGSGSHDGDAVVTATSECNATVGASVIAVVENVTYFDTCVTGKKFEFTSVFDANKLSASDFFAFCNSSTCLAPMHTVMHSAPLTCLITYKGSAQNLTGEITELHDKCHKVKDAAKAAAASTSGSSASTGLVSTPTPTTSAAAASVNSMVLAAAIASVVGVASFLF